MINAMFSSNDNIKSCIDDIESSQSTYKTKLEKLQIVLADLNNNETDIQHSVKDLLNSNSTFTNDATKIKKKAKYISDIKDILKQQNESIMNIIDTSQKYSHCSLEVDNILFDNIVLLDRVFKNFNALAEIV